MEAIAVAPSQDDSLESAKAAIFSLDFSQMIDKMCSHEGWRRRDAEAACLQYRRFLWLNRKYSDKILPPTKDIDAFWHMHILDTQKYHRESHIIFGEYLHHYPYLGIDGESNDDDVKAFFDLTKTLYQREFGEPLLPVRVSGPLGMLVHVLEALDRFCDSFRKEARV